MYMESEKEVFLLPKEFPFRIYHACGRPEAVPMLHWHDCLELNLVKGGSGKTVISDVEYQVKPGEIYVINNNERHYSFSDGSLDLIVIIFEPFFIWQNTTFDYEYLKPFFERNINFQNLIGAENPFAKEIGLLMYEMEKEFVEERPGYRLIIKSCLMKILALLYRHFKLEGQIGTELIERQREFDRIKDAVAYIDAHYSEDITLKDVSKLVFMNPSYFSTFFRRVMNVTVTDYILSLRINHAAYLLRETAKSVTEISMESGFYNLAYFTRAFKKATKLSPKEYRKASLADS